MQKFESLIRSLTACSGKNCGENCGWYYYGAGCRNALMSTAAGYIENLGKFAAAIPHKCECCIGCEIEEAGGGCDTGFIPSPDRIKVYLDTLVKFRERMDHIKAVQFVAQFGRVSDDMVAYFDDRKISEEEVIKYITGDTLNNGARIAYVSREFAENVFGYKWEDDNG